jgi:D-alanyl-D-alanine carboxypeptidase
MSRRWAKHAARLRDGRDVYIVLVGKLEEKHLKADGRTILKWIFRKEDGKAWTELI